jgi:protein TonB
MSAALAWTYEKRDPISYASAIFFGVLILWLIQFSALELSRNNELEMTAFIESPPAPEIIKPQEQVKKVVEKTELPKKPEMVMPKQVTSPFATEAPREVKQAETPVPIEKPQVHQSPAPAPPPIALPTQAPTSAPASSSVSSIYEAQLRAYLEKIKRYPTSREARLTRPQGAVRVWLEISRSGQVLGAGVLSSSGSNLLDGEALKTLKNGFYPAFPDEAYVGESAHKFSATLSYTLEAQ